MYWAWQSKWLYWMILLWILIDNSSSIRKMQAQCQWTGVLDMVHSWKCYKWNISCILFKFIRIQWIFQVLKQILLLPHAKEVWGMEIVEYWTCCTRFKWNKHRCTYVHWRIYSSRDLDTLLHKLEVIWNGNHCSLYTNATIEEKGWDCSQKCNWHIRVNRITIAWETVNCEN